MSVTTWLLVAVLGAVGSLARFQLDGLVQTRAGGVFPFGTLAVNLAGSFCLGLLTGLSVTGTGLFVLGTGLLGSFTTFSTWMLEAERLAEEGEGRLAFANIAVSLAAGLAAALAGWLLGGAL
jgi:fluoride exporter